MSFIRAFFTEFFLLFIGGLSAIYSDTDLIRETDPSGFVHHVSVVDGSYSEMETDLILSGPDSIGLRRLYSSHGSIDQTFGGWTLSPETLLFIESSLNSSIPSVLVGDRNGSFLRFDCVA